MAKRGENIYQRKDGRWEGRYVKGRRANGKPIFGSVYGRQYREVKRRLAVMKARQSGMQPAVTYGGGTLADWLDYWLEELVCPGVKATTYDTYARKIDKHILPYLGQKPIRDITGEDIRRYLDALCVRISLGTARDVWRILHTAFREAREKKLIASAPYEGVKGPKRQQKKPRFLHKVEQAKIERESISTGRIENVVALYTGLRLGELCALTWEDVDFETNTIHVRRTLGRIRQPNGKTCVVLSVPKSLCSVREVPVPAFVIALLSAKAAQRAEDAGFVFGEGEKPIDPRTVQLRFKRLTAKLGIEGAHMHTLRHTFATRCLEQQVGHEVLCELLGHSSPEVTYRYYAHCTFEHKKECVNRLEKAVI